MTFNHSYLVNSIKVLFEKVWVFQPIINNIGFIFPSRPRIYIFLVFHTWALELIVFLVIFYLNLKAYGTVYAMQDDPTDRSKVIMDQPKLNNSLISDEQMALRIAAIVTGPHAQAFNQDLTRITLGDPVVGALNQTIANVIEEVPLQEHSNGFKAIIIFIGATVLGYILLNHWEEIFSFMGRNAHHVLGTLDPAYIGERAFSMYLEPETRARVEALVSHYYNNNLL